MFLVFVNKKNVPFSNWIVSNPVMAEKKIRVGGENLEIRWRENREMMEKSLRERVGERPSRSRCF